MKSFAFFRNFNNKTEAFVLGIYHDLASLLCTKKFFFSLK